MNESCFWDGSQVASTLTTRNAGGAQRMPDKENFNAVIQEGVTIMGEEVTPTLVSCQYKGPGNTQDNLSVVTFRKQAHPQNSDQGQGWEETTINDTLNIYDNGESRTPTLVVDSSSSTKKVYDWHRCDTRMTDLGDVCNTMSATWGTGGNNMPMVMEDTETPMEEYNKCFEEKAYKVGLALDCSKCSHNGECLRYKEWYKNNSPFKKSNAVVRRLTPLECERLQSFPDNWTNIGDWVDSKGKKHKGDSDSPRYKALGNSIALPYWQWMLDRMAKSLNADGVDKPTMASLFDGIGGFCLCSKRVGIEPIWTSEIEDFPIAVTRYHFGDEDTGETGDIEKYL